MTRHYIGNHDRKCSECGSYIPKANSPGLNRIQCTVCKTWNTEYKNPNRKTAD